MGSVSVDAGLIAALEGIVGRAGVVATPEGRLTYECDMPTFYKGAPDLPLLPPPPPPPGGGGVQGGG